MSDVYELIDEELEKVSGGTGEAEGIGYVICKYRDYDGGEILEINLGISANAEEISKQWCQENGKLYDSYSIRYRKTDVYNTQLLLDTVSNKNN